MLVKVFVQNVVVVAADFVVIVVFVVVNFVYFSTPFRISFVEQDEE